MFRCGPVFLRTVEEHLDYASRPREVTGLQTIHRGVRAILQMILHRVIHSSRSVAKKFAISADFVIAEMISEVVRTQGAMREIQSRGEEEGASGKRDPSHARRAANVERKDRGIL